MTGDDSFERDIARWGVEDSGYVIVLSPCLHVVWSAVEPQRARMYCAECLHMTLEKLKEEAR